MLRLTSWARASDRQATAMRRRQAWLMAFTPIREVRMDIALTLGMPWMSRERCVVPPRSSGDHSRVRRVCGCETGRKFPSSSILIDVFGEEAAPHQQSGVGTYSNLAVWPGNPRRVRLQQSECGNGE